MYRGFCCRFFQNKHNSVPPPYLFLIQQFHLIGIKKLLRASLELETFKPHRSWGLRSQLEIYDAVEEYCRHLL